MDLALMFEVLEGGVSKPIKWNIDNLSPDKNIIILDEGSSSLYLWYGSKQGLVARRTALRQAESLKGHGYVAGKSIIGRDIKVLKEIDQRKIGREHETDKLNEELQNILNREFKELDNYIITFNVEVTKGVPVKEVLESAPQTLSAKPIIKSVSETTPVKPITKPEPKLAPMVKEVTPVVKQKVSSASKPEIKSASEYDLKSEISMKIDTPPPLKTVSIPEKKVDLDIQAKIGFVLMAILDHYDDIWISKKEGGSYGVEMMDGPICQFSIKEGSKIAFTANSFSGIATNVKTEIQKKFVELSKLL